MKAYLINMHQLVPRSSAKVKVNYKGYISQKNGRFTGIRVSQTHLVFSFCFVIMWFPQNAILVIYVACTTCNVSEWTSERLSQNTCKQENEVETGTKVRSTNSSNYFWRTIYI